MVYKPVATWLKVYEFLLKKPIHEGMQRVYWTEMDEVLGFNSRANGRTAINRAKEEAAKMGVISSDPDMHGWWVKGKEDESAWPEREVGPKLEVPDYSQKFGWK